MSKKKKILLTMLFLSLSLGIITPIPEVNINLPYLPQTADSEDPLLIGTTNLGTDLDPSEAWDSASNAVIDQVSEGLFAYALVNRNLTIVPRLASNYGSWNFNNTEYTVPLREDVIFHNGHPFNATAVKTSFDRLHHLIDLIGLPSQDLYKPLDNEFVINSVEVINEFTVKFVLNYSFSPFEPLLCFGASYIVDTSVMPADSLLNPLGILIGTGPYKHMGNDGSKVSFEYFPTYYRGIPAAKYIQFIKYSDSTSMSLALLSGEVDAIHSDNADYIDDFRESDRITVENEETGAIFTFLGMNNDKMIKDTRQAISYAIDYDNVISDVFNDTIVRSKSILPPEFMYYKDCDVANLNLNLSRSILIDAGLSKGLNEYSSDSEWIAISESLDPVAEYNFTYNDGNIIRENLGIQLQLDLSRIGISIVMENMSWMDFLNKLINNPEQLELFIITWVPDYNDPNCNIYSILSNASDYNYLQINDVWLQNKIIEGLNETDKNLRKQIYDDLQDYITTDLMPICFIGFNKIYTAYGENVKNFPVNALFKKYYYYCTWWDVSPIIIDPFVNAYYIDSDRDGLANSEEENTYGTDPFDTDSDNDGLLDGEEVSYYITDPTNEDTDNDGLLDGEEVIEYGTSPRDSDSDNDGLLDGEEVIEYGTDPLDVDTDNDEFEDGLEIELGTDPLDPNSFPNDIDPFMYFLNIPGYSSIIISLCLVSTVTLLIWKSKRNKITFVRI